MLNDFFTSRDLNFLLLCETWVSVGKNKPFPELPLGCNFLNTTRVTWKGGGVAGEKSPVCLIGTSECHATESLLRGFLPTMAVTSMEGVNKDQQGLPGVSKCLKGSAGF